MRLLSCLGARPAGTQAGSVSRKGQTEMNLPHETYRSSGTTSARRRAQPSMTRVPTAPLKKTGPVVLCLSGGGFRATFFHLGVVRALAEAGLLDQVHHVFSVSGGSILAAHMALNWSAYTSADERVFRRVSDELVEFGRFDVRGRIARRFWVLPFASARTRLLQHYYEALYRGKTLKDLPDEPSFHFMATSLTSGQLCSFDKEYWTAISLGHHGPSFMARVGRTPVARVVAASSAFPPFFGPVQFLATAAEREVEGVGVTETGGREWVRLRHYVTDGGVFDNLGVAHIGAVIDKLGIPNFHGDAIVKNGFGRSPLTREPPTPSRVFVSDASAVFDHADASRFRFLVSRTARSMEILMSRLAALDIERAEQSQQGSQQDARRESVSHLSIRTEVEAFKRRSGGEYQPQATEVQRQLRLTRTDLDYFNVDLVRCLVRHGYEVATRCLEPGEPGNARLASTVPWDPSPHGTPTDEATLVKSLAAQKHRLRRSEHFYGAFNARDPICWFYVLLILAILVAVVRHSQMHLPPRSSRDVPVEAREANGRGEGRHNARSANQSDLPSVPWTVGLCRNRGQV